MEGVAADLAPSGTMRAAINLGNPVLAHGTPEEPGGVTVDLARELARRLGVPVRLACFGAARDSYEAMAGGRAGTTRDRRPATVRFLRDAVEELKAGGFVAAALRRAGQSDDLVAPPATDGA